MRDISNAIEVSPIESPLDASDLQDLKNTIDPLSQSSQFGVDVYLQVIEFVMGEI